MGDPISKAYNAINGLKDINYIIDRREDKNGKVALKRFFFFDNKNNAYREIAGRNVKEIDKNKLSGEMKLAKLRRFEQVWGKYGNACLGNKDHAKVQKMISMMRELANDIGDLESLKGIIKVTEKDRSAMQTLKKAISLIDVNGTQANAQKKVAINATISKLKADIKTLESDIESFYENVQKGVESEEINLKFAEYRTAINQYDLFVTKNRELFSKSVMGKHEAYLKEKNAFLESKITHKKEGVQLMEAIKKFKNAEHSLSTVAIELEAKLLERNKWDPPKEFENHSLESLKQHKDQLERVLREHEKLGETLVTHDVNADREMIINKLLVINDLLSEARNKNIANLDKEIEILKRQKESLMKEKNKLESNFIALSHAQY